MQNFIRPFTLSNGMWGQSIGHLKFPDVQPHMLPHFKLYMPLCFVAMFSILLLSLLLELLNLGIFLFMPLDHLHSFFGMIPLS